MVGEREHELQTRSRIVHNQLKDRDNCIILRIDTDNTVSKNLNPFGFHFELDKEKYNIRKKQLQRERITQLFAWIAYYHHKYGIRHLLLVGLLIGYVCVGGAIFNGLEAPRELEDLRETVEEMTEIIIEEVLEIDNITAIYNGTERDEKLAHLLKRFYKTMLEAEGRFHGSAWHKAENLEMRLTWHFSSACFYCMTLFTTIGYGSIAPQTAWGRIITVIYACIGIPLMLVVLGDLGEWFQKVLTNGYIACLIRYRKWRKLPDISEDEQEDIFLPIWLALPLVAIFVSSSALFIRLFDHNEGSLPGIGYADAFYYTFISLTTIGLGDIMPYNIQYSPILSSVFLLGLALVSIVNTSIYAQLYDVFYNSIKKMETSLDKVHRNKISAGDGYKIFQDMEPSIRLLVCSFPHVGTKIREGALEGILKSGDAPSGGKKDKKVTYNNVVRKRTISYTGEEEKDKPKVTGRMRAPTLGAFGGRELAKYRKQASRRLSDASSPSKPVSQRRNSDATSVDISSIFSWKPKPQKQKATTENKPKEDKTEAVVPIVDQLSTITVNTEDETVPKTVLPEPKKPDLSDLYDDGPSGEVIESGETNEDTTVPDIITFANNEEDEQASSVAETDIDDDDLPPEHRPAPLLEMPVLKPPSDEDDEDSDDEWVPPTNKFMQLKRGSYFVPRQETDSDEDDEGPAVEYIP